MFDDSVAAVNRLVLSPPTDGTGPEITVVVPAFNAEATVFDTVRSVLRQSFADFELLVIDDGSASPLAAQIAARIAPDPRLRVIAQANAGLAGARNRGLAEARGRFVGFLDADDLWHPDFLRDLRAALLARPEAPFAYGYSLRVDDRGGIVPSPGWQRPPRHDFSGLLAVNSVGNGSASLFRTQAVREAGGFDPTLRQRRAQGAEDWKLCLRLAARHAPVLVPRPRIVYRLLTQSMSQRDPGQQMRAVQTVMAEIAAEVPDVRAQDLRDAQTMMNGWLMGAFVRKRAWGRVLWMLVQSYLLNPFWMMSRDLRAIHWQKLAAFGADLAGPRKPLWDWEEAGTRPFAFLAPEVEAPGAEAPGAEAPSARH